MKQYIQKNFNTVYKATIGADFLAKELILGEHLITMQIWDTAGGEKFQSLQAPFYNGADACMIVFDLTIPATFNTINSWKDEMLMYVKSDINTFPFILVGNKADLKEERRVSEEKIMQWCKENGDMMYFETSAKTASQVKEAFEELAKKAMKGKTLRS